MFKKILLLSAVATATAVTPTFADGHKPMIHPVSSEDWSGFYAGINAGIDLTDARATRTLGTGVLIPLDISNGLFPERLQQAETALRAGASIGYDRQMGNFVLGVVGSIGFSDQTASHGFSKVDPNPNPPFNGVDTNTQYTTEYGFLGTARVRGGFSVGKTLAYATAGLAVGQVKNRFSLAIPQLAYTSPDWSASGTQLGYTAGVGVEHKITKNISLSLEGLYTDLKDQTTQGLDPANFPGEEIHYTFKNDRVTLNMGVNLRF